MNNRQWILPDGKSQPLLKSGDLKHRIKLFLYNCLNGNLNVLMKK